MNPHRGLISLLVLLLLSVPMSALAQGGFEASVEVASTCGVTSFETSISGGTAPFEIVWDFGDGEMDARSEVVGLPMIVDHDYGASGEYEWSVTITDSSEPSMETTASGSIALGPRVSLTSDPFPPLLPLIDGQATLTLTASAAGGEPPYAFAWDPNGDGVFEPGAESLTHIYLAGGKVQAAVQVTDSCGLTATGSLPVVVVDPEAEACHPMAQRIADGVNTLFPNQSGTLYTCEDIFGIKGGDLTGQVLGYGRLWHAYKLAQTMEELTWEEILQWKLEGTGWGLLTQLDRLSETLTDVGLGELFDMVVAGDASVGDIRTAARAVTHYEADFFDALERLAAGANPGELGQLYRTASDLGLDPLEVDDYLAQGLSLAELRHAGRLAEQANTDLDLLAMAHADGSSWGEIHQAIRLAGEGGDPAAILGVGVRETRQLQHEERNQEREQERLERQEEVRARIASRLAERFGVPVEQVQALADGICAGDWDCVQATLRETYGTANGGRGGKK